MPFRSQGKSSTSHLISAVRSVFPSVLLLPLLALLLLLLYALQQLFLLERAVLLFNNQPKLDEYTRSPPALVTMADPTFQYCAMELVKSARNLHWNHSIFILTIDFHDFDPPVIEQLQTLGVSVVETNPTLDRWLNKSVQGGFFHRKLAPNKFRKIELLLNPIFRSFERLIFIDADTVLSASLDPLISVQFPQNTTILMRQNDKSMNKRSFWGNEILQDALTNESLSVLKSKYPDRDKTGATCSFILNVRMLQPPQVIFTESVTILCNFRAAFKLNDQTLFNLLFYGSLSLFPWCVWDEIPVIDDSDDLAHFCQRHIPLQKRLNGDLDFIFRHMNPKEKNSCTSRKSDRSVNGPQGSLTSPKTTFQVVDLVPSLLDDNKSCLESFHEWKRMLSKSPLEV